MGEARGVGRRGLSGGGKERGVLVGAGCWQAERAGEKERERAGPIAGQAGREPGRARGGTGPTGLGCCWAEG